MIKVHVPIIIKIFKYIFKHKQALRKALANNAATNLLKRCDGAHFVILARRGLDISVNRFHLIKHDLSFLSNPR